MSRRAFTLIELLTVIAITAILMTIIVLPIFQSFNLTRAAQAFSDAQDKARVLVEKIQREINNGAAVRDNTGLKGSVTIYVPNGDKNNAGTLTLETIPYAKVDIVKPAEGEPDPTNPGVFRDPNSGKVDPTLHAPKGQVILPVAQGSTIVRYFVGLRDPFRTDTNYPGFIGVYNNPYDALLQPQSGGRDNLFVLYRAEVPIYIWSNAQNRYIVNSEFFEPDPADPTGHTALVDDRFFFLSGYDYQGNQLTVGSAADVAKNARIDAWRRRSVIQTEVSRYDMIMPIYNKANHVAFLDTRQDASDIVNPLAEDRPRLLPLIQFRPTRVSGEPAEGQMAVRLGEEMENAKATGPDVFTTAFGGWVSTTIRAYPSGFLSSNVNQDEYLIERLDPADGHIKIFEYDPGSGTIDSNGGIAVFDVTIYNDTVAAANPLAAGPFNAAVLPGAVGSVATRNLFMAFVPDTALGKVMASFGIETVKNAGALPAGVAINQPIVATGISASPLNDSGAGAVYSGAGYEINRCFNRVWNDPAYLGLRPDKIHRFIDLRVTPQIDGGISPLDPTNGFGRCKITSGTDVVIGPDQNPGPNFGNPVRYTRTTRAPGPNQYKINYVDLNEPDYSLYGLPNPPAAYTPTDFVSAVFQPRFKVGYIQLNSDPNVPLPAGNFKIYYRFQFTGGSSAGSSAAMATIGAAQQDAFAVDYDTRQLMGVQLTIRNYPQSNIPNPQTVTLSATAKVRNYLR